MTKRYFKMNDGATCIVVATDLPHAEKIMRYSGAEFGPWGVGYDTAKENCLLSWSEMTDAEVIAKRVHREDGCGLLPLVECALGDWFCTEWRP